MSAAYRAEPGLDLPMSFMFEAGCCVTFDDGCCDEMQGGLLHFEACAMSLEPGCSLETQVPEVCMPALC